MPDSTDLEQPRKPKDTMAITDAVDMVAWNRAVELQSLSRSGFCGRCGEAVAPFVKGFPKELIDTACEYSGEHPDCGDHNMKMVAKPSETLGNYEIWECQNDNCDYAESY